MKKLGDVMFGFIIGIYVSIMWIRSGLSFWWIVFLWCFSMALNGVDTVIKNKIQKKNGKTIKIF